MSTTDCWTFITSPDACLRPRPRAQTLPLHPKQLHGLAVAVEQVCSAVSFSFAHKRSMASLTDSDEAHTGRCLPETNLSLDPAAADRQSCFPLPLLSSAS